MAKYPLVIGLTGGIGAGKSTVTALFSAVGTPVIDADIISRELVTKGTSIYEKIIAYFGKTIVDEKGDLRRQHLREKIFQSEKDKTWLEMTLHPEIYTTIQQQIKTLTAPYVIVAIPLLLERGRPLFIDRILVVDTSESLQKIRASQRDHATPKQIEMIMQHQLSRAQRLALADDVILNESTLDYLKKQVNLLHQKFKSMASTL